MTMIKKELVFADVFAGCGGLSLGLLNSGWKGLFAIEKNPHAFATLKKNLIDDGEVRFDWPTWLPKTSHDINGLLRDYKRDLVKLRGSLDLLVGGPPCQGFSSAGRRDPNDPRNLLFKRYLKLVGLLQPKILLIENVQGISLSFLARADGKVREPVSDRIQRALKRKGYSTFHTLLRAVDLGVPQNRPRFFIVGIRKEAFSANRKLPNPFSNLITTKTAFFKKLGICPDTRISVSDAISDLQISGTQLMACADTRGFSQIVYNGPTTPYQQQMHGAMNGHAPNSLRLPKHTEVVSERFKKMLERARKGVSLSESERKRFGVKKMSIVVLDGAKPSHTLTTLPDDLVHYSEPRILTVREYARIQSFPDWFEFHGTYTTGGARRKFACPRYTQVGNAVPPRVAWFLGDLIKSYREALLD